MNTEQVAKRLVELCREGKGQQAQDELYSKDAVSVEMEGCARASGNAKGIDAIREKGTQFKRWHRGRARRHASAIRSSWATGSRSR